MGGRAGAAPAPWLASGGQPYPRSVEGLGQQLLDFEAWCCLNDDEVSARFALVRAAARCLRGRYSRLSSSVSAR